MGKVIMSGIVPQLVAPSIGIKASDLAVGSTVKLNENGSPVEFYVAKHDYESDLNGAGRTLLVRKDCYDARAWHSSAVNDYAASSIDSWLDTTYKDLLDDVAQKAVGTTTFYYTQYNPKTVTTLSRSVFMLSATELGRAKNYAGNDEGSVLEIADVLKIGYKDGVACAFWTRSPVKNVQNNAFYYSTSGAPNGTICTNATIYSRPCFTIPSTAVFDEETLILKGVA